MRQLTLAVNADSGALTLVDRRPWETCSPIDPAKAYILRLPREIIIDILEIVYISCSDGGWSDSSRRVFRDLPRVHPLMRDAACMFLYRNIEISILPRKRPTLLLHRSLKENPALGAHVRDLHVHFGDYGYAPRSDEDGPEGLEMLQDFVKFAGTARELHIHSSMSPKSPVPLSTIYQNTIPKLSFLEVLGLYGRFEEYSVYGLQMYNYVVQAPMLRRFALSSHSGYSTRNAAVEPVSPALERTSAITEMALSNGFDGFDAAAQLLRLPKHLKKVTFQAQAGYGYKVEMRLLFKELEMHGSSLETIDLSYMDDDMRLSIDLSPFKVLKTLKLSWWSLISEEMIFSKPFARGLLGPALNELTLQLNIYEQTQPLIQQFRETGISWIQQFGRFAAEQKAKLKCICIEFHPEGLERDDSYYPWDLLDTAKDDLAPRGIELVFEHPFGDKQGFLNHTKRLREEDAEQERQRQWEDNAWRRAIEDEATLD